MVYFVGAGPGAVDLITVRGMNILKNAKCIMYTGSLVNPEILNYADDSCIKINSAYMTLDEVIEKIIENEDNGIDTVRLHTGDSSIYGAVREQFDILAKNNIDYDVTPGVSSFLAAAASLKTEYTIPDVSQSIIITRMEGRTPVPEKESIESFGKHNATMIIFLSIHMIDRLSDKLKASYDENTPVAVIYKASWNDEIILKTNIKNLSNDVKQKGINKTALVIVGNFLNNDYSLSKLYDKNFSHEYRNIKENKENKIINIVGIGSGEKENLTYKAYDTLNNSDVIVGYNPYIEQIKTIFPNKIYESTGMKKETERCRRCIDLCQEGKRVSLISSGDSGIYGMAGLLIQLCSDGIKLNVVSGVTSCIEAASTLGAPLMNDFAVISLSDLMTPIDVILKKIEYAAKSDTVICIYNPKSKKRKENIVKAFEIIKNIQTENVIVGVVKNAGRKECKSYILKLKDFNFDDIDMNSIIIVGNSQTIIKNGKMITKRGYKVEE